MRHKKIFLIISMAFIFMGCYEFKKVDITENWKVYRGNIKGAENTNFNDSQWQTIKNPNNLHEKLKPQTVWVRKDIYFGKKFNFLKNEDIAIYLGKIIEVDHTYFNGIKIGTSGREHPKFFAGWNIERCYFIPQKIIKFGEKNTIAVKIYAGYRPRIDNKIFISELHSAQNYTFWKRFSIMYVPMIIAFITLWIGFTFFLRFIANFHDRSSLVFSILCFIWFVISSHFFLPDFGMPYILHDKIYYSAVSLEIGFIYFFLESFLKKQIKLFRIFIVILIIIAVALTATATDNNPLPARLLYVSIIGIIAQIFWGIQIIASIISGNKEARVMFFSYLLFATCLTLELLIIFKVITRYLSWINLGYLCILGGIAIIMSKRVATTAMNLSTSQKSLREKNKQLYKMIKGIKDSINYLTSFSESIGRTAESVQDSMREQGVNLEQSSAAIEEVTSSIKEISDNAKEQDTTVQKNKNHFFEYISSLDKITEAARNAVTISYESMGLTDVSRKRLNEIINGMDKIKQSSGSITEITEMMNDIAEQTNLLSLNASIEAARAGQYGRGFAVVAEEIGKLAERSIQQAKLIQNLVTESLGDIDREVDVVKSSAKVISDVESAVGRVGGAIDVILDLCMEQVKISENIKTNQEAIALGSKSISDSTNEQSVTILEVTKALDHLNIHMQNVIDESNGLTSSLSQLVEKINNLKESIGE